MRFGGWEWYIEILGVENGRLRFGNGTLRFGCWEWYFEIWRVGIVH